MAIPDLQATLWAWVQSLPPWQSDLLRRLTIVDDLSEEALDDATRMVLAAFGAADDTGPAPVPIPALSDASSHRVTRILSLRDLVAVGSIEKGQRLDFVPEGLTIVFGGTGSGKSSYARVLRKACRSSAKSIEILPNVLKAGPGLDQTKAGTAQIEISLDGAISVIGRDVNAPPEVDLGEVSVFDSDCVDVYADEESEITYTPSSLRLLERLVALQVRIRKGIDEEIAQLKATPLAMDGFDGSTKAGALVNALNENVNPETIKALATLSTSELAELAEMQTQIASAQSTEPARAAAHLEKRANAADALADTLDGCVRRTADSAVAQLVTLNEDLAGLAAESSALAKELAQLSKTDVGSTEWKRLWRAAHAYVASLSGHGGPFPPATSAKGAHCPLCHQELTTDALQRFEQFEHFFQGEVEKAVATANADRTKLIDDMSAVGNDPRSQVTQIGALLGDDAALEVAVGRFIEGLSARVDAIRAAASARKISVPALPPEPMAELRALAIRHRRKAAEQRDLASADAIARVSAQIRELENRKLLGNRCEAVLGRIEALKKVAKLKSAFSALTTTGLSRRIGEFTETAVTEQLRSRLAQELSALGAGHIPVMVGARGTKGKTSVSLRLDSSRRVDVGDVLSEGERRAVALAFFLAEVAVAEHGGGIVLDDPVSSLDHTRRSYVAGRLVDEASRRQAIVFTHDVVFLLELQDQARQAGRACHVRVVRRVGHASGVASNDLPWVAQNVKARIGFLRGEKQTLAALERKGDVDLYRREVKVWFELLREAWERAVEEKLFGGVVGRFQPGIETLRLKSVEVTSAMTAAVETGMTRASAWTHDQAPALGKPPPTASDLDTALDELVAFVGQFKK